MAQSLCVVAWTAAWKAELPCTVPAPPLRAVVAQAPSSGAYYRPPSVQRAAAPVQRQASVQQTPVRLAPLTATPAPPGRRLGPPRGAERVAGQRPVPAHPSTFAPGPQGQQSAWSSA